MFLLQKYRDWMKNKKVLFTESELLSLKDVIYKHHAQKISDTPTLLEGTTKVFREILLTPFKNPDAKELPAPDQALRRAAFLNKTDYVCALVKEFEQSIINQADSNPEKGNTALHLALLQKNIACANALLSLGADLDLENCNKITPRYLIENSSELSTQLALPEKTSDVTLMMQFSSVYTSAAPISSPEDRFESDYVMV